jgi:hypothetical protein
LREALKEAKSIDAVKEIRNKAIAMEVYSLQAKDAELITTSTEIKKRAERRLGEMMEAAPKNKGGGDHRVSEKPGAVPTLTNVGIDKNLANRARKEAKKTPEKFEADLQKTIVIAVAAAEGHKEVIAAARAERHQTKKKERKKREAKWADKVIALPSRVKT